MEKMKVIPSIKELNVGLNFGNGEALKIGRLATRDNRNYFEYDREFLDSGLQLSPFRLPLEPGLKTFNPLLFEGLPGLFNDSLPDGWGRLLMDRWLKKNGVLPNEISSLDRLAFVGTRGLGAMVYEPDHSNDHIEGTLDLDQLASETIEVLDGETQEVLDKLISLNGSSAGARPKVLVGLDKNKEQLIHGEIDIPNGFQQWIVKFANTQDGPDSGAIEYVYSLIAREAGILMPETHLFNAKKGAGYFAVRRFDRHDNNRYHMHTVSGLLHSDFRTPSLDYKDLQTLTGTLTRDIRETKQMLRLALFNVMSHNRDDHGKNFSFLMNKKGEWSLSPAYDLTFSSGPGGQQSTMVLGEGQRISMDLLKSLAKGADISHKETDQMIDQIKEALNQWEMLARNHGVSKVNVDLIGKRLMR